MPKINVNCSSTDKRRVEVVWQSAQFVQLGAVKQGEQGTEWGPNTEGEYVDLDRAGINRLIQALRQARDAAFGKDA